MTRHGQEVLTLSAAHCIYRGVRRRTPGWRMAPDGVSCTRPGRFKNPHRVSDRLTPENCVHLFDVQVLAYKRAMGTNTAYLAPLVAKHAKHGSLTLYCFCDLKDPCHCTPLAAAVVAELERLESAK